MNLEKVLYTATVSSSGEGRNGHVRSSDGLIDFDVATPKEMGGKGGYTNPEQLFAAGYAACFHSALLFNAKLGKIPLDKTSTVTAQVGIGPMVDQEGFGLTVTLTVNLPGLERAQAEELVRVAHLRCPYSNAIRGNVPVELITEV